jgi:hypothetical protein
MKLLFSFVFILVVFSSGAHSKKILANYEIKTRGIIIGSLSWEIEINDSNYKAYLNLKNKGFLSSLYKFRGEYTTSGKTINGYLVPEKYKQIWITKKKRRDVQIFFKDFKILKIENTPEENEKLRINYKDLLNYTDPITSFINILLGGKASYTIDGRRAYLLSPYKTEKGHNILIEEYKNMWADHKRNDLEYLEFYEQDKSLLPKKINIGFKGSVFYLNKI